MEILGFNISRSKKTDATPPPQKTNNPRADWARTGDYGYTPIDYKVYNGETTTGEMGGIIKYDIDYNSLRLRSWQAYLESPICKTMITRLACWVIGNGLKLQAEPQKTVLESEGIKIEDSNFSKVAEARFRVYADDRMSDYANQVSLHKQAERCFIDSFVGGDTLVIIRFVNGLPKVQLIDGETLCNPIGDFQYLGDDMIYPETGNLVRNGIEYDSTMQPTAYFVRKSRIDPSPIRIEARPKKTGLLMAFMVYGGDFRLGNKRGMPGLAYILQLSKQLQRYTDATVSTAEEIAKVAYTIEHGVGSSGASPLKTVAGNAFEAFGNNDLPVWDNGAAVARDISISTGRKVYNLDIDSKVQTIKNEGVLHFAEFSDKIIQYIAAALNIPPDVAMSMYNGSFSASRAALKDWEHTLVVLRKKFSDQFYQPIYEVWLYTQVLQGKVMANGLLNAAMQKNTMALSAFYYARFVGANVPHIDPEKEVRAYRLMQGADAANVPLTTNEYIVESLVNQDFTSVVEQYEEEMEYAADHGIDKVAPAGSPGIAEQNPKSDTPPSSDIED